MKGRPMTMAKTIALFILAVASVNIEATRTAQQLFALKKVMVFAPHPDDDILGCGGTLAQHTKKGAQVTIVYMTSGDAEKLSGVTGPELARIREEEAKKGAAKVGVSDLVFLRHPDGKLARSQEIVKEVAALILKYKPEVIYMPHKEDAHKDHQTTFWIVEKAIREVSTVGAHRIPLVLCYEVWTPLQKFTHKIDTSDFIEIKLAALSEHKSQLAGASNTNYVDAVKALNRYRGIMTWVGQYGECFQQYAPEKTRSYSITADEIVIGIV